MIRRLIVSAVCILVLFSFCQGSLADERVVFVDMERLFSEFDKTKMADNQLKKQAQEFAEERQKMIDEATDLRDEVNELRAQASDEALSEEAREDTKKQAEDKLVDFRKKEEEIKQFNKLRAKQLEDQGKRMRENIVEEITSTVVRYARNNGYIAVVDSSAQSMNSISTVLYVDSRYDVTDAIIALLNGSD